MARKIHSRLKVNGTLLTETPLHVGGFGESVDTDLPLAQNGKGEWYVPGTSIAGVLRSWCEKNFKEPNGKVKNIITQLFAPRREKGKEEGHASFILVEDASIDNAPELITEVRDGVGIDRFYGVAADKAKFDRAILPRGTKLSFLATVEIGEDQNANETKAVIRYLLEALTKSRVRFGAAKTRGLGRLKLKNCRIKEERLDGFDAIIKLLKDKNDAKPFTIWLTEFESPLKPEEKKALKELRKDQPQLTIEIGWKPRLPVMVKAGYDGIGVDMLPLTSGTEAGKLALVLPGSSIKGVLRSHAEMIIRTLLSLPSVKISDKPKVTFHDQINNIPLIDELFGAKSEKDRKDNKGLGALAIDDCYAIETMNTDSWRKVETARDDKPKGSGDEDQGEVSYFKRELWRYLREIDEQKDKLNEGMYKEQTKRFGIEHHVAIDRWTGGASEGALYSVLAPNKAEWEPMRLTLDLSRISEKSRLCVLMLLFLTLRDVTETRLPFGFATNRGMGEISVEKIVVKGLGLSAEFKELEKFETSGKFVELSKEFKDRIKTEWDEWRKNNQQS